MFRGTFQQSKWRQFEEYTTEDQNSVVRFLWFKALNAKDIHKETFHVYCEKCLSGKAVHNWV
jgi:hypothetical protein